MGKEDDLDLTGDAKRSAASLEAQQSQAITKVRQELYDRGLATMDAMQQCWDIDEDDKKPPDEWIEKYGEEQAWRRFRIARAALMSTKDAPIALKLTADMLRGMDAAKRNEGSGVPQVGVVVNVNSVPDLPSVTISGKKDE